MVILRQLLLAALSSRVGTAADASLLRVRWLDGSLGGVDARRSRVRTSLRMAFSLH